ncbi:class I SAM-dependent methyltransferase [Nocardia huaxiensis]|uniref:Class I SAM-dependent methyltransferase n=1 Tax=Nocardia huaxiensis TaxID=2755382 RepID=A0A7D6VFV2_9NOCA|nr:class I SAM-dependent methyltransferase [Nocardia huaxiensis]QLY31635.1 class I SAM-dependent methyltransferase [Nocardia huaxiensis]UFS95188.1 class I SAM-dependent methyltransferase [Nocardia huaxiensis]
MPSDSRFEWIAELMRIRPDDRILEIGAGSSPSVAYLAAGLTSGWVLAIDRSATAITRSAKKHAALVDSGKVELRVAEVEELLPEELPDDPFTKILAVNVNLFWTRRAATELALIRNLLAPGGRLYLAYGYGAADGDPSESPKPAAAELDANLAAAGFTTRVESSGDLLCVIATPDE